jgi:hypothetical protein
MNAGDAEEPAEQPLGAMGSSESDRESRQRETQRTDNSGEGLPQDRLSPTGSQQKAQ